LGTSFCIPTTARQTPIIPMSAVISDNLGDARTTHGAERFLDMPAGQNPNERFEQSRSRTPETANNTLLSGQQHTQTYTQAPNTEQTTYVGRPQQETRPHPPTGIPETKNTRAALKIASLNIRGGGSPETRGKWQHINQIMRDRNIGVMAVQETHTNDETIQQLHNQFSRLHILNSSDPEHPNAKGVALVLNKQKTAWKEASTKIIEQGRAILLTLPWQKVSILNILAVYAPNGVTENANFWERLENKWREENLPMPDILMGDMNIVEDSIDRLPTSHSDARAAEKLESLKADLGLQDGWRRQNPELLAYSYKQASTIGDALPSRSRIDRIYVTTPIYENSSMWEIEHTAINTDHCLVSARIANPGAPYIGRGRWQIPHYLIKHRKTLPEIKLMGTRLEKNLATALGRTEHTPEDKTIQGLFEAFKMELTTFIRNFAKKDIPKMNTRLQNEKTSLKQTLNEPGELSEERQVTAALIEERIKQLEILRHYKTRQNTATRNRIEEETLGKHWVRSNKEKAARDTICMLRDPTSQIENPIYLTRSDRMAEGAKVHHQNLQEEGLVNNLSEEERNEVLNSLDARLAQAGKAKLSQYLMQEEVEEAMKDLPEGKSPGIDGIPHELWKHLARVYESDKKMKKPAFNIAKTLTIIYNDIEKNGLDGNSKFAKGWMCPIYKKGNETEIGNYRPITVLNTDYKIMTRALTTRLSKVAPLLIHPDQAGFVKGRRIEDQTELVWLMLNKCEVHEENGIVVCLDQEKAYDKVRHDFIWATLNKLNFPQHFINTVKTLYENAETVIIINGVLSAPYKVKRGVRQGDPLSCLIFDLAIESLACMIRKSNIKGFEIDGAKDRLVTTLFADDTTVYLSIKDSYNDLRNILTKWCRASGAKFNDEKTVIIPVGTPDF